LHKEKSNDQDNFNGSHPKAWILGQGNSKIKWKFWDDTERLEKELGEEIEKSGLSTLIDHLRLCGNIPEAYDHDSSEEKQYSKYTDSLLSFVTNLLVLKV